MTYEEWKRQEELRKFRERQKTRRIMKRYKPKKRTSVRTVSGGLPSLGRKR